MICQAVTAILSMHSSRYLEHLPCVSLACAALKWGRPKAMMESHRVIVSKTKEKRVPDIERDSGIDIQAIAVQYLAVVPASLDLARCERIDVGEETLSQDRGCAS